MTIKNTLSIFLLSVGLSAVGVAQTSSFMSGSMASYNPIVAPDSIAAGFGTNLATATTPANSLPLLTSLGNAQVSITDSAGKKLSAPLYLVSATQINYLIPANAALGKATVTVTSGTSTVTGSILISNVAPAIISIDSTGKGVAAAQVVRRNAAGTTTVETPFKAGSGSNTFVSVPIGLTTSTDQVYLMLYGTGIRRHSGNPVKATIGGVSVPVTYAGPQSQYPGLDQINIGPLPQSLAGKGDLDVVVIVDGIPANTVRLGF